MPGEIYTFPAGKKHLIYSPLMYSNNNNGDHGGSVLVAISASNQVLAST